MIREEQNKELYTGNAGQEVLYRKYRTGSGRERMPGAAERPAGDGTKLPGAAVRAFACAVRRRKQGAERKNGGGNTEGAANIRDQMDGRRN